MRNIDLPRKVKFRERYKKPEFKVDKGCHIGRNFQAFEEFIEKNPDAAVVHMDSVIGSKGGKCLLTIHFVQSNLMTEFLRDANTSQSVIYFYNGLDKVLGGELFNKLFSVILTDDGSEFLNLKAIEYRDYYVKDAGFRRTSIYYCDPSSPYQK